MSNVRLAYRDFRPLRKGEGGYSATKRLLVSPSTGEIITRREFMKRAERIPIEKPSQPTTKKPRKPRQDKGVTRKDYQELVRPALEEQKKQRKKRKKRLTSNTGKKRYESAKKHHIDKLNNEREKRGYTPLDYSYEPEEPEFYDYYDAIKHPDAYDSSYVEDAYDYFWGDAYDYEVDYDYPFGETP